METIKSKEDGIRTFLREQRIVKTEMHQACYKLIDDYLKSSASTE